MNFITTAFNNQTVNSLIRPFMLQFAIPSIPVMCVKRGIPDPLEPPSHGPIFMIVAIIIRLQANGDFDYEQAKQKFARFGREEEALDYGRNYCNKHNFVFRGTTELFTVKAWDDILSYLLAKDRIGKVRITEEMHQYLNALYAYQRL